MDLALNNLQRLICHKTQQTKPNLYLRCIVMGKRFQFIIVNQKKIPAMYWLIQQLPFFNDGFGIK